MRGVNRLVVLEQQMCHESRCLRHTVTTRPSIVSTTSFAWSLVGIISIGFTGNQLFQTLIPYAIAIPALLVVIGLASSWQAFWRRPESA